MILSPYRNPPYRSPTRGESSSPASGRSPKRKRDESAASNSPPLQMDSQIHAERVQNDAVCPDSPRMKVTEKFKNLDIQQINPSGLGSSARRIAPRKRLKRNHAIVDNTCSSDPVIAETPDHSRSAQAHLSTDEAEGTPDLRSQLSSTFPSTLSAESSSLSQDTASSQAPEEDRDVATEVPSPSPQTPAGPSAIVQIDRSVSPLPARQELTPDQAALTWQEDEITGHEIDVTGDDDGEGINGIGFKPTPAIAFARKQKRKQQVNEWRAREAKEARQKRIERRRADAIHTSAEHEGASEDDAKRMVRFQGVG